MSNVTWINIPDLRFNGFSDEWEEKELEALANKFDNERVPISARNRTSGNTPYYGANGIQDYVEGYTHKGEYVLVAEDGANDIKNYPVQYINGKAWINNHAHVLQGKKEVLKTLFLKYLFSQTNIEPFLVGGGRAKLNASVMMKINFVYPQNINEQTKIGNLFKNIDELITNQDKKIKKLENIKKALLEKMFPQNGATTPKLRFKVFNDDWEECKLRDIADIIGGGTPNTSVSEYWNGSIDWYAPAEIEGQRYAISSKKKITELGFQKSSTTMLPAKKTLLFTSRAGIGKMAILLNPATTNQGFQSLVLKDGYNSYFIYSLSSDIKKKAESIASGSTFLEISGKMLGSLVIQVVCENEQTKIGNLFKNIDDLIAQQNQKLEKLKNIKTALLGKMFV